MMTDWYAMFLKSTYVLAQSLLISSPRKPIASKMTSVTMVTRTALLNAFLFVLLLSLNGTGPDHYAFFALSLYLNYNTKKNEE